MPRLPPTWRPRLQLLVGIGLPLALLIAVLVLRQRLLALDGADAVWLVEGDSFATGTLLDWLRTLVVGYVAGVFLLIAAVSCGYMLVDVLRPGQRLGERAAALAIAAVAALAVWWGGPHYWRGARAFAAIDEDVLAIAATGDQLALRHPWRAVQRLEASQVEALRSRCVWRHDTDGDGGPVVVHAETLELVVRGPDGPRTLRSHTERHDSQVLTVLEAGSALAALRQRRGFEALPIDVGHCVQVGRGVEAGVSP